MQLRSILDALFDGKFICQTTEPDLFSALVQEDTQEETNTVLQAVGLELRSTLQFDESRSDLTGVAFYAAYVDLDNPRDSAAILKQFQDLRDQVSPVMEFILLLMKTQGKEGVFTEGDTLRFSELLSAIESESTFQTELKHISQYTMFSHKRVEKNSDILTLILNGLAREGYLLLKNKESLIYQFSGKISYFYNTIQFILEHEEIPINDESVNLEQQGELLL